MVDDINLLFQNVVLHILYSHITFFKSENVAIDGDDPEHIEWIYKHSLERANDYNIHGITYRLTQGMNLEDEIL